MTDGEKMVWAAAFAVALDRHGRTANAVSVADVAVNNMRETQCGGFGLIDHMLDKSSTTEKKLPGVIERAASEPSDVEAALVEAIEKCERGEMFFKEPCTAAGRFRDEVERRIGRPLRGAK